jgi:hypothetical protein
MLATVGIDVAGARNNSSPIAQNIRFGSKADLTPSLGHVRFTPQSGQIADMSVCPLRADILVKVQNCPVIIFPP